MMWPLSPGSPYVNIDEVSVACVSVWSLYEGFLQKADLRKASTLSPQAVYLPRLGLRLITKRRDATRT